MKKVFKYYVFIWAVLFALFNALAFIVPAWPTLPKFTASFWIGYASVNAAFIGQLACAFVAFKAENLKKLFYNISLVTTSYIGLVLTFVIATVFIVASPIPEWIAAVVCLIVLAATAISVVKAKAAINIVSKVDEKIETATAFVYELRAESESVLARARGVEAEAACKKVCDALKYSDPMSRDELCDVEAQIKKRFELFKKAICEGDDAAAISEADELLLLIGERNRKCKTLK